MASDLGKFEWGELLALYAAVVSTLVLIFDMIKYLRERRGKIKVEFFLAGQTAVFNSGAFGALPPVYKLKLVNQSSTTRFITQPAIRPNLGEIIYVTDIKNPVEYPIELKSGAEWQLVLPYSELSQEFDKRQARKVRAIVTDTLGKTYKSSWLRPTSFRFPG